RWPWATLGSSALRRLQIGADARHCLGPRVAPVAKIEDEPGIPHCNPAESGWGDVSLAQKFLYLSKQMHGPFLIVEYDSAGRSFPTHSYLSRYFPIAKGETTMLSDPRIVLEKLCA